MSSLPTDTTDKTAIDADVDRIAMAFQDGFTNGNGDWNETPEYHKEMFREGARCVLQAAKAEGDHYPVMDYDLTKEDLLSVAVTQAFGDRCDDFNDRCPCCLAWKQYDEARSSAARAKHFEDHFQRVAKEHGPSNRELDTARREWAKKGEGK